MVRVVNAELYDEAPLNTSCNQLLSLVYEETLLDEAHIEGHLLNTVQVLIKDEQLEILGAGEVQMILDAVADAADLAARLAETLGLRQVLCHTHFKVGLEDALPIDWVPHVDSFLIV